MIITIIGKEQLEMENLYVHVNVFYIYIYMLVWCNYYTAWI